MKRIFLTAILIVAVLIAAAPSALARSIEITRFDAGITVNADGSIDVSEVIDFRFTGSWNGVYRSIPVDYRTPQGFNASLILDVVGVYDPDDNPYRYEVERRRHYKEIKIWIPGARDANRRVVIKYRVSNALGFFDKHDELYWNITGDEWEFPIRSASATIILPRAAQRVRAAAYTGAYGSKAGDADVNVTGNVVHFAMRRPLSYREGLTAVVGWEKGLVSEPSVMAKTGMFFRSNWPLLIPLLALILMFRLWYTRGRDPRLRPIAVRYEPPDNMSPAEAGTLIDNAADMRDITATIVDLAVQGFLEIEETETTQLLGLIKSQEYVFHLKKPAAEWEGLRGHEQQLLSALFEGGSNMTVELSALQNKFYRQLPGIRDCIFGALMTRRYYRRRPDTVKAGYTVLGIFTGVIMVAAGLVFGDGWGISPVTAVASGMLTLAVIAGFGLIMPARTVQGTAALEGVMGFAEFLERVDTDRYERVEMTPALFERFLPYAMAFGVEKHWAQAFDWIYKSPPEWYRGRNFGTGFRPYLFAASLNQMSNRATQTMVSSPRGKGGSGFGGGGSSGGGGGGGGGGGF